MPRARIDYRESADEVTFTYRLPGTLLAPAAGLWCVAGGVAVGIGLALALVIADIADDPTHDPTVFRTALALGTLGGALALYGIYARAVWQQRVRVVFDYAQNALILHGLDGQQQAIAFNDAIAFQLLAQQNQRVLVLETGGVGPVMLLALDYAHDDPQLANFTGRLDAYLTAIHSVPNEDLPAMPDKLAAFSDELNDLSRITGTYDMPPDLYASHHQPPE